MILENFVNIKVNPNSREYYISLGYNCSNYEILSIKTLDLPNGSNFEITAVCDFCSNTRKLKYNRYLKNTKNNTIEYSCKKCSNIKSKRTKKIKYGDENWNNKSKSKETRNRKTFDQNNIIKEKRKETCLSKWGVVNPSQVNYIKEKRKKTYIDNYGVENPFESIEIKNKIKETCLSKWGVENYINSDDFNKKYKEYFLNNYGVDHYSKSDEFKVKFEETCLKRWGAKTNLMNDEIKNKISNTNLVRYGFDHVMKNKDISLLNTKSLINNRNNFFDNLGYVYIDYDFDKKVYKLKNKECGHLFDISYDLFRSRIKYNNSSCLFCYPKDNLSSIKEKEIFNWISYLGIKSIENDRNSIKKEIDILLPDLKIGIEFNGLYYHSDKFKEKNYHLDKTIKCNEVGISLIHIWEDDWLYRKDIVKSILLNRFKLLTNKIYARQCVIKMVDSKSSKKFLNENHIQGNTTSSIRIGLYKDDELVSLMTFGNRRINSKNNFELIRFCNRINTLVIGGANKLFNFFLKEFLVSNIVSYSDISMFDGGLYKKLGFENDGNTSLNYYWTDLNKRYHRFNFNKKKLVKLGYDENLTEEKIMKSIGFYKIWGCGQIRWLFKNNF